MANKRLLLGISGGIAACKIPMLVSLFVKNGYEVRTVATENALRFVSELSLQTLSCNKVYKDMFLMQSEMTTEHISNAQWADMFIVSPATADLIGKYANAIADDVLTTSLLAFEKKVILFPAMNTAMYNNVGVQENIQKLKLRGVDVVEPNEGKLACGTSGKGRMPEIEEIFQYVENSFSKKEDLKGKTFLLTAGPTVEQIDSVRFISNNSSGKMGYALAEEILSRGGRLILVSGPTNERLNENKNLTLINVKSAKQMYEAAMENYSQCDVIICSAAVADYTPKNVFEGKMKKKDNLLSVELEPTKDILKALGEKKENRVLVGFALE